MRKKLIDKSALEISSSQYYIFSIGGKSQYPLYKTKHIHFSRFFLMRKARKVTSG